MNLTPQPPHTRSQTPTVQYTTHKITHQRRLTRLPPVTFPPLKTPTIKRKRTQPHHHPPPPLHPSPRLPTLPPPTQPPPWSRIEGTLFIPHTPNGLLARELQTAEDNFAKVHGTARVKMIERGGVKIMDTLGKKDPWAPEHCGKTDCLVCNSQGRKQGSPTPCRQESICYMLSCDRCKLGNVTAQYCGESARTAYLRGKEHKQGQEKMRSDNPLHKHDMIFHEGVAGQYTMKVLRKHKKPLARQIQEATTIDNTTAQIVMNSKGEYLGARVPRITVEMGAKHYSEDYRGTTPKPNTNSSNNRAYISTMDNNMKASQRPKDNNNLEDPELTELEELIRDMEDWEDNIRTKDKTTQITVARKRQPQQTITRFLRPLDNNSSSNDTTDNINNKRRRTNTTSAIHNFNNIGNNNKDTTNNPATPHNTTSGSLHSQSLYLIEQSKREGPIPPVSITEGPQEAPQGPQGPQEGPRAPQDPLSPPECPPQQIKSPMKTEVDPLISPQLEKSNISDTPPPLF